jgi:aryl-alcohol dehydrogenase-like predicted oxidoreductase
LALKSKTLINSRSIFPIGLGAMPLSIENRPDENEPINIIETFVENGGNFIDTADVYGLDDSDRGHNEKLIHKALKQLGYLDQVLIATKGGATRPNGGWGLRGAHPKKLRKACEQSLINLNVASHGLYYLHGPDPAVPLEDSIGELQQLKNEGKIIHIGIANVNLDEIKLATSLTSITAIQNRCNPFCKGDFKNGVIEFCKLNNIVYVPYSPLGGWTDHANLAESPLYKNFTLKYQVQSYTIALAWLLNKNYPIIPIPGMDKSDQVLMNFQALDLSLLSEDITKIDEFPDLYSPKHLEL